MLLKYIGSEILQGTCTLDDMKELIPLHVFFAAKMDLATSMALTKDALRIFTVLCPQALLHDPFGRTGAG
jgi:hypothetical protein